MSKSILVIGSNSFSGSNFCDELLNYGHKVIAVSRTKELNSVFLPYKKNKNIDFLKFYQINLNKYKDIVKLTSLIDRYNIKFIVNFAAQGMVGESWISPNDWYQTNVVSNSLLIKNIQKKKIFKYLNFSTPEVYGNTKKNFKESFSFNPTTPYAISRAAQDMNLLAFHKNFNFPVVFTRAANVYGAGQQLYRIVPKTIMSAIKNKKMPLHGSGKSIRSFIDIRDVNKALYGILFDKNNLGETFHISTEKFISIKSLTSLILKKLNKPIKILINTKDRDGKDQGYILDSKKLRKKYKWKDSISLELGIDDTINWIKSNYKILSKYELEYRHKK
jgi:dTDP-glucose 4,6-dehydratase